MKRIRTPLFLTIVLLSILLAGCTGATIANSWPGATVEDNNFAYLADANYVYAIKLSDGSMAWRYPAKADARKQFYAPPVLLDGQVIAGNYGNSVSSINAADGTEKWVWSESKDRIVGSPLVVNNLVLVPSTDHYLYALKTDGSDAWKFKTGDPIWAQPVTDGQTAYVASMDHKLYALDPATGSKRWEVDLGAPVVYSLAISEDKSMLYAATVANKLLAVNAADGKILWNVATDGAVWSPVVQHGDLIYFGDQSGKIYALSTKDGSKKWGADAGSAVIGSPAVTDKIVAFPSENNGVLAFDFNGTKSWNQPVGGKLYSNLVYTGDRLVVPVTQGQNSLLLAAINPNGTQLWSFTMPK